jgi:hypothetical protein
MRPHRPRGIASTPSLANINADTIRRAEEAVSKLASQYREWVRGDLAKLRDALAAAKAGGVARDASYEQVRHIAHDLRGQGSTFGYPLITRIAQSISQTLKTRAADADSDAILAAHVDAIAVVIEQNVPDEGSDPAARIIETLQHAIGRTVV